MFWNDAVCVVWQVAQSSPGGFARRNVLFWTGLCIEWHVRQFTAAELACTLWAKESCVPFENESCPPVEKGLTVSWHARQSCAPLAPRGIEMKALSPPLSMCFVPSPWQVEHMSSGSGFLPFPE